MFSIKDIYPQNNIFMDFSAHFRSARSTIGLSDNPNLNLIVGGPRVVLRSSTFSVRLTVLEI